MSVNQKSANRVSANLKTAAAAATLLIFATSGQAQTWVGNNVASQSWGTVSNWSPNIPTFGNTADLNFPTSSGVLDSYVGAARSARSFTFGADVDTAFNVVTATFVGSTVAANLTFDTDAGNASITVDSGATGNITIGRVPSTSTIGGIVLADNLVVNHNGSGVLLFNRAISGSFGVTKNGTGTLTFNPSGSTSHTFTGALNINQGRLIATGGAPASGTVMADFPNASAVNLGGGTLELNASTNSKPINMQMNVTSPSVIEYINSSTVTRDLVIGNATGGTNTLVLSAGLAIRNLSADPANLNNLVNIPRNITGAGTLTVSTLNNVASNADSYSRQRVQLSGDNSGWTGDLVVARGTAQFSGNASHPTNTGSVTIGTTGDSFGAGLAFNQTNLVTFNRNITVTTGGFRGLKSNNLPGVADVGLTNVTGYNMVLSGNVVLNGTLSVDHSLINSTTTPPVPTALAAPATILGHTMTLSGNITGNGGLNVTRVHVPNIANPNESTSNLSRLVLSGTNTYIGPTSVSSTAALIVDGSLTSNINVNGGRFGGVGSTTGSLTMVAGSTLVFNPADPTFDVTGAASLDSGFSIASLVTAEGLPIDWTAVNLGTYTLLGTTSSSFANVTNFGVGNAVEVVAGLKLAYFQNGSLQLVVAEVPEPAALTLVAAVSMLTLRRRRA
jgi:autotransporter-associated beta strand protein